MRIPYSAPVVWLAIAVGACQNRDTSRLRPEREAAVAGEGVVHRAANLTFRYTHDGWEDRVASIIVTRQSVLIYTIR